MRMIELLKSRMKRMQSAEQNMKKSIHHQEKRSDLFGIGQHRLREIVREDYGNKYHLMLGRTIKIKRKQFEEFIDNVEQI